MPRYGDFLDLAAQYPSVMLDTTMAFTDFVERTMPFPRERLPVDHLVVAQDDVRPADHRALYEVVGRHLRVGAQE